MNERAEKEAELVAYLERRMPGAWQVKHDPDALEYRVVFNNQNALALVVGYDTLLRDGPEPCSAWLIHGMKQVERARVLYAKSRGWC